MLALTLTSTIENCLALEGVSKDNTLWLFHSSAPLEQGKVGESILLFTQTHVVVLDAPYLECPKIKFRQPRSAISRAEMVLTFQDDLEIFFHQQNQSEPLFSFPLLNTQKPQWEDFQNGLAKFVPDIRFRREVDMSVVSQDAMAILNQAIELPVFHEPQIFSVNIAVQVDPLDHFSLLNQSLATGVHVDDLTQGGAIVAQNTRVGQNQYLGLSEVTGGLPDIEIRDETLPVIPARTKLSQPAKPRQTDRDTSKDQLQGSTCESCGRVNKPHYHYCLGCGGKLKPSPSTSRNPQRKRPPMELKELSAEDDPIKVEGLQGCALQIVYIVVGVFAVMIFDALTK